MYKYKTADGTKDGVVPNVGELVDGVIYSEEPLENPNLELVSDKAEGPVDATPDVTQAPTRPITASLEDAPAPVQNHTPAPAKTQNNGDIEL